MGLFNFGAQSSSTQTRSSTDRDTFIAPQQLGALQGLYGGATNLQQLLTPGAVGFAQGSVFGPGGLLTQGSQLAGGLQNLAAGRFGQGLSQTIGQLQQQGMGQSAAGGLDLGGQLQGTQALQGLSTSDALSQSLLQPNPALQGSLDVLGQNIQENLRASLGTLGSQAGLAGARGGARQALAAGQLAGDASRAFAGQAGDLISQDFATRQQLAPALLQADQASQLAAAQGLQTGDLATRGLQLDQARLMDAFQGLNTTALSQAGQLGLGAADTQRQAGVQGIDSLASLFGLGLGGFTGGFGPLTEAARIIGAPAILEQLRTRSRTDQESSGFDFGIG